MEKLIFSLFLVVGGTSIGYWVRYQIDRYKPDWTQEKIDQIRKNLQRTALLFFNPIAILGATWVANIRDLKIVVMPVLGISALLIGGTMAFVASKMFKMRPDQTGAYIVCGGFTNIGSLGALFCFLFLGEKGFALVPFYKLFEESIYYAIGFPIAKAYSQDVTANPSFFYRFKSAVTDIFVIVALGSILTGLILNISDIPRPEVYRQINTIFIPVAALLLLVSIGMAIKFTSIKTYFKPALFIAGIKFILIPMLIFILGSLLGLGSIDDGLPLKVVLILSSMPVGFIAMVPPTLYRLDIQLANSCWLMTNGLLLLEIPFLYILIALLF